MIKLSNMVITYTVITIFKLYMASAVPLQFHTWTMIKISPPIGDIIYSMYIEYIPIRNATVYSYLYNL